VLSGWRQECDRLVEQLGRAIPEIALQGRLQQADAASVAQALPAGSVLIEFVAFPAVRRREKLRSERVRVGVAALRGVRAARG